MTKSNALQEQKSGKNLPAIASDMDAWGAAPALSIRDLIIPRLLLGQGMSKRVTDGKMSFGEMIDTDADTVVAKKDETVEVIPFKLEKVWLVKRQKAGEKKFSFAGVEAMTPQNEEQDIEGVDELGPFEKDRTYNIYFLLASDITGMPRVVSFRRTSSRAGKQIVNIMYVRNRAAGLVPPATVIKLGGEKVDGNDHTYMTFTAEAGRSATGEEIAAAKNMMIKLGSSEHKVDYSEEQGDTKPAGGSVVDDENIPF